MSEDNDWGQPGPELQQPQQPAPQAPSVAPQPGQMQQQAKIKHTLETNDMIPIILSIFLPGVGHIMAGQTMKGLAIIAGVIFTCGVGYTISLLVAADAYFVVMCKKDRPVGDWEFFPDYNRYI
jgi:TM2 domain-containing membrane protein YozV